MAGFLLSFQGEILNRRDRLLVDTDQPLRASGGALRLTYWVDKPHLEELPDLTLEGFIDCSLDHFFDVLVLIGHGVGVPPGTMHCESSFCTSLWMSTKSAMLSLRCEVKVAL